MSATAWPEPSWIEPAAGAAPATSLRVLVADEREVLGWGFRLLLARRDWVERCVTARSAAEALALARTHQPQLALVQLELARAVSLSAQLQEASPGCRVVLTSGSGPLRPRDVRDMGADDAICTAASAHELVRSIESAATGLLRWRPTDADGKVADAPALSRREQEILELMSEGETNREIAAHLFLSPYTVKQHTTAVYRKLGVRNRTEAAQRARRLGLIA